MRNYDIAAYIWPAYTGDEPRSRMFWPEGIGEWQSVKNAVSKFPGHNWPRKPLWGYVNEADPYVMEMQIEAAVDHGVNLFIYDWYWYDRRPYLENCLNDGFLRAKNNEKMQFYIMWANHTVNNTWDIRLSHDQDNIIWDGAVDRREFEIVCHRIIERYFSCPNYYKIDGKPVFMIYDLQNLVRGLGGLTQLRQGLDWFRGEVTKAGFPGLHLQLVSYGPHRAPKANQSGVDTGHAEDEITQAFEEENFDSLTHYQFAHFINIDREYGAILQDAEAEWARLERAYRIPFFPHISVGWDNNPRFQGFRPGVVRGNTPELFAQGLRSAKAYADRHTSHPPLITINSWNEWTETSYLQPDDLYGYGYLEAIRDVFGKA